jgi:hypothetical protein
MFMNKIKPPPPIAWMKKINNWVEKFYTPLNI